MFALLLLFSATVQAAVLQVGSGKPYNTVQAAHDTANNGDTIEVYDGGTYKGTSAQLFLTKSLVIKGIGDRPRFDCEGSAVALKGCWLIESAQGSQQVTIENVEIFDVRTDGAGSCIRHQDEGSLTLRRVVLHDCEHGLLTGNFGTQDIIIEDSEFRRNGTDDGQAHNIYVGEAKSLLITRSRSYNSRGGQLVKSRAKTNVITYNDLGDPESSPASNYEIDLSCGGIAVILGNKIHQSSGSTNRTMVTFAPENCQSGDQNLKVVGNLFHNDILGVPGSSGNIFVRTRKWPTAGAYTLELRQNLYTGDGDFWYPEAGLNPDLSTNLKVVPPDLPTGGFAGQVGNVKVYNGSQEIRLAYDPPAGATRIAITRNGVNVPNTALSLSIDPGPFAPSSTNTYVITAWKDATAGPPLTQTVLIPPTFVPPTLPVIPPGWYEVANSRYLPVAPTCAANPGGNACGNTGPSSVVRAYSGGTIDQTRNRFILWGAGHLDYYGNETYEVCLDGACAPRLITPQSPIPATWAFTNEDMGDTPPTPGPRHTFNNSVYVPQINSVIYTGGSLSRSGYSSNAIWKLDLTAKTWARLSPTGPEMYAAGNVSDGFGHVLAVRPDGKVYIKTVLDLFLLDLQSNTITKVNPTGMRWDISIYANGAYVPSRDTFVFARGSTITVLENISTAPVYRVWRTLTAAQSFGANPGVAYDNRKDRVVLWNGGERFGIVNLAADAYTEIMVPNGPGPAVHTGTFNRFGYLPGWDVFALQNWETQNVFLVKLD
jgi:hypothetical protein